MLTTNARSLIRQPALTEFLAPATPIHRRRRVDFDMALLVLTSGLYRLMARRMRGYADGQARQIFQDLIDMPADIAITDHEIWVRFHRRAHLDRSTGRRPVVERTRAAPRDIALGRS
jgi:hypothetical protein